MATLLYDTNLHTHVHTHTYTHTRTHTHKQTHKHKLMHITHGEKQHIHTQSNPVTDAMAGGAKSPMMT